MKRQIIGSLFGMLGTVIDGNSQPFHTDSIVNGVQTLEVEGDLSVKDYSSGLGGNLKVVGDAHFAAGGVTLDGMPAGVGGLYYGTQQLGTDSYVGEFVFTKTGTSTTGDFVVPLGCFGQTEGSLIKLDILVGPQDSDSGAAHYTLMGKRHQENAELTAVVHTALGGGKNVRLHGLNVHGLTYLFVEFDAESNHNTEALHRLTVKATSIGKIFPNHREFPLTHELVKPVRLANTLTSDSFHGDSMTQKFNAQNIHLNGIVSLASSSDSNPNIVLNGGNGRVTLLGAGSGIYAGSNPLITLDGSGGAAFGSGIALNITNPDLSSSSTTGALRVVGGIGVGSDSYINGIRIGKGGGNEMTNTAVGGAALDANMTGYFNTSLGYESLKLNTTGSYNSASGFQSLRNNSTGGANAAFGTYSLLSNTTGNYNTGIGIESLYENQTGDWNTAVGARSLHRNTTGIHNTAVGGSALLVNTVGGGNVAIGFASSASGTVAGSNTSVGFVSMSANVEGNGNTAVGNHAAYHLNGGNRNLMLGAGAGTTHPDGQTPLVTPEDSIYIGYNSRGKDEADFNSIVIGVEAVGEGANTTVIGKESTLRTKIYGKLETTRGLEVAGDSVLKGAVVIEVPQGDISMGIYQ